jgi:hypothetical protein
MLLPMAAALDWAPGARILDEFLVERELGRGGSGVVYLVTSEVLNRPFAVKRLHDVAPAARAQFLAELARWIDLPPHPNLARCAFYREHESEILVFSEYAELGSMEALIARGELGTLPTMLDAAIQLARGLQVANEADLVHCDVKPSNAIVERDRFAWVVKVCDFGSARASGAERNGGATIAYRSPRQAAGGPLDWRTDLWSWALSVLTIFSGEVYWLDGQAAPGILDEYQPGRPANAGLPALPDELRRLLARCFALDPREGWASWSEVIAVLVASYERRCGDYPRKLETSGQRLRLTDPALPPHVVADIGLGEAREIEAELRSAEVREAAPPRHPSGRAAAVAALAEAGEASSAQAAIRVALLHQAAGNRADALKHADRALALLDAVPTEERTGLFAVEYASACAIRVDVLAARQDQGAALRTCDRARAVAAAERARTRPPTEHADDSAWTLACFEVDCALLEIRTRRAKLRASTAAASAQRVLVGSWWAAWSARHLMRTRAAALGCDPDESFWLKPGTIEAGLIEAHLLDPDPDALRRAESLCRRWIRAGLLGQEEQLALVLWLRALRQLGAARLRSAVAQIGRCIAVSERWYARTRSTAAAERLAEAYGTRARTLFELARPGGPRRAALLGALAGGACAALAAWLALLPALIAAPVLMGAGWLLGAPAQRWVWRRSERIQRALYDRATSLLERHIRSGDHELRAVAAELYADAAEICTPEYAVRSLDGAIAHYRQLAEVEGDASFVEALACARAHRAWAYLHLGVTDRARLDAAAAEPALRGRTGSAATRVAHRVAEKVLETRATMHDEHGRLLGPAWLLENPWSEE